MHPGAGHCIGDFDDVVIVRDLNTLDLQRMGRLLLQHAVPAKKLRPDLLAIRHANSRGNGIRLRHQVIITGRQPAHHQVAPTTGDVIEVVFHEDPATFLEQGHNLVQRTVAGIHQRNAQRPTCQHVQQRRMRGTILRNPPLVRSAARSCHVDPNNILKCPES